MSFASNVKSELCRAQVGKKCCAIAESYGVLLFCNTFTPAQARIVTESADFALRLPRLFARAFGVSFDRLPDETGGKRVFVIEDAKKLQRMFDTLELSDRNAGALHLNFGILERECCQAAFLRGAFLAGGSVTDPTKRYHLELATGHLKAGKETYALLLEMGFAPKEILRGGNQILYFKQSDAIEDFLTKIGAMQCSMGVMEAKMEKDLRNDVNRRCNCETANLTKVVDAAQEQIAAIRILEASGRLEELPDKLRSTALLRRKNPEATLSELADMLDEPVTKSAMNHRMRKLIALAREEE